MKKFNLDEYLANPNRKIVTRDGRNVRIICINAKGNFPIIALVETHNGTETVLRLKENGHFYNDTEDPRDLFFTTKKQERWINIYKDEEDYHLGKCFARAAIKLYRNTIISLNRESNFCRTGNKKK